MENAIITGDYQSVLKLTNSLQKTQSEYMSKEKGLNLGMHLRYVVGQNVKDYIQHFHKSGNKHDASTNCLILLKVCEHLKEQGI